MGADKRIPVTEETYENLAALCGPDQTWDDLIADLIQIHNRRALAERATNVRDADADDLTSLDDC